MEKKAMENSPYISAELQTINTAHALCHVHYNILGLLLKIPLESTTKDFTSEFNQQDRFHGSLQ